MLFYLLLVGMTKILLIQLMNGWIYSKIIIQVGNKNDLEINIEQRLINDFVKENKISFISISAKENNNIEELFEEIGKKLYIDYLKKGGYTEQDSIKIKIITKKKIVAFIKKMTYNLVIIV